MVLGDEDPAQPCAALAPGSPLSLPLTAMPRGREARRCAPRPRRARLCVAVRLPLQLPLVAHPAMCLEITSHSGNLM